VPIKSRLSLNEVAVLLSQKEGIPYSIDDILELADEGAIGLSTFSRHELARLQDPETDTFAAKLHPEDFIEFLDAGTPVFIWSTVGPLSQSFNQEMSAADCWASEGGIFVFDFHPMEKPEEAFVPVICSFDAEGNHWKVASYRAPLDEIWIDREEYNKLISPKNEKARKPALLEDNKSSLSPNMNPASIDKIIREHFPNKADSNKCEAIYAAIKSFYVRFERVPENGEIYMELIKYTPTGFDITVQNKKLMAAGVHWTRNRVIIQCNRYRGKSQ